MPDPFLVLDPFLAGSATLPDDIDVLRQLLDRARLEYQRTTTLQEMDRQGSLAEPTVYYRLEALGALIDKIVAKGFGLKFQQAPQSDPAPGMANLSAPPKKKRRGRVADVSKIDMALTELSSRLKSGDPVTIVTLAKAVGCVPENLGRSKRFMAAHRELTGAMARAVRYKGSKIDGNLEAYTDPRGDLDEDEDSDF